MSGRPPDGARTTTSMGRMPQAPASLLVQLPPDELKRYAAAAAAATSPPRSSLAQQSWANSLSRFDNIAGPSSARAAQQPVVQASDVALLAASIQERREREARVFTWQQRLIGGGADLERATLKRALTQLSLPAWLQVLQERHLAHRCAYPTCGKRPKKPHMSHSSNTVLPLDAPRYRISLRRRAIERDERDDAGGENGFCSNACWRRGEWVSRWVLNDGQSTRQVQREVSDEQFGSAIRDRQGLGNEVEQGGRWERLMDEEHWTEIELLEDLEDKGEVDRLSDDETCQRTDVNIKSSPRLQQQIHFDNQDERADSSENGNEEIPGRHDLLQGQPNVVARERAKQRADTKGTAEGFLNMLDSLVIQERDAAAAAAAAAVVPSQPPMLISLPSEPDDVLGEFSTRRGGSNGGGASLANLIKSSARREIDHRDHLGDIHMSEGDEDDDDKATEQPGDARQRRAALEQKHAKRKEEDDLFELAMQAMNAEKAKGTWDEQ